MLEGLGKQWHAVRADAPGTRFRKRHERRRKERKSAAVRVGWTALAVVLVLVGIVAMPLPGPGFIPLGLGVALLAEESLWLARAADRTEVAVRRLLGRARRAAGR